MIRPVPRFAPLAPEVRTLRTVGGGASSLEERPLFASFSLDSVLSEFLWTRACTSRGAVALRGLGCSLLSVRCMGGVRLSAHTFYIGKRAENMARYAAMCHACLVARQASAAAYQAAAPSARAVLAFRFFLGSRTHAVSAAAAAAIPEGGRIVCDTRSSLFLPFTQ